MADLTSPVPIELADVEASPRVALAFLEALRDSDTPAEVLGDEDLRRSFPRRLGLSDAVGAQIRRYEELHDHGSALPASEVADLLELVSRRADAGPVFDRAGEWLLRRHMEGRFRGPLAGVPLFRRVRLRLALGTARKVAREVNPTAEAVRIEPRPAALVVEGSLPVACGAPEGCRILEGALRAALEAYGFRGEEGEGRPEVVHPLCEARGDGCCLWRPQG